MGRTWLIRIAARGDLDRWMAFVATVQDEFHGLDLANDEQYRAAVIKNIARNTAVYVCEGEDGPIIGAVMYSPRSRHVGWLAVSNSHRRSGVGRSLVRYVADRLGNRDPIRVRTFMKSDPPGETAHAFYRNLGFRLVGVEPDSDHRNAGHSFALFELPASTTIPE